MGLKIQSKLVDWHHQATIRHVGTESRPQWESSRGHCLHYGRGSCNALDQGASDSELDYTGTRLQHGRAGKLLAVHKACEAYVHASSKDLGTSRGRVKIRCHSQWRECNVP